LFKGMTVLDNLLIGRHFRQRTGLFTGGFYYGPGEREEIAERKVVEEIIDFLEIEHVRKKVVHTLPYGLQKRVELARALALEPKRARRPPRPGPERWSPSPRTPSRSSSSRTPRAQGPARRCGRNASASGTRRAGRRTATTSAISPSGSSASAWAGATRLPSLAT